MNKKSQLIIEFLLTYGWIILIILAGSGILIYNNAFGIFNEHEFCDNNCEDTIWTPMCEDDCVCTKFNVTASLYSCSCYMPFNNSLYDDVMELCRQQSKQLLPGMYCYDAISQNPTLINT